MNLTGSLCVTPVTYWYIQIATCSLLVIFVLPLAVRKRGVVLMKILDFVQIIAYFKFINGYTGIRHIWLYLGMRSWGSWSEGWNFLTGDQLVPIWTNEEGHVDKAIRICCVWLTVFISYILAALLKQVLDDKPPAFSTFLSKNLTQILWISFYITVQDMAFILANVVQNPSFSSLLEILSFTIGIVCGVLIAGMLLWGFYVINFPSLDHKHYQYQHMFLLCYDYDLYPTYQLLNLPQKTKQINQFSNLRLFGVVVKVAYSFLIVEYLRIDTQSINYLDEIYYIAGFLACFEMIWLVALPMDIKKEYVNFGILILGELSMFALLFLPWYWQDDLALTLISLLPYWLMIATLMVQFCMQIYKIIPVDLYATGLRVVIEDKHLMAQLQQRKKQIAEQNKKLKEMQIQKLALLQSHQIPNYAHKEKLQPKLESEQSLGNNQCLKSDQGHQGRQNGETNQMDSEDVAGLYKIDETKRRKVYQWDKKNNFHYSNKMDMD